VRRAWAPLWDWVAGLMADLLDLLQFWSEPEDRDGKLTVWSTLKLDGKFFPGVADLDNPGACIAIPHATRELITDKLKPINRNNSSLLYKGHAMAKIDITVRIWTIEQWRAFLNYLPKINPSSKIKKTVKVKKTVLLAAPATDLAGAQTATNTLAEGPLQPTTDTADALTEAKYTVTKTTEEIPSHTIEHPFLEALGITMCYITSISTPDDDSTEGVRTIKIQATEIIKSDKKNVAKKVADISRVVNDDSDTRNDFKLNRGPNG